MAGHRATLGLASPRPFPTVSTIQWPISKPTLQTPSALFRPAIFDRASAILGNLIQAHPNQPALYHLTGLILKKKGLLDHARAAFEKGVAVNASMPGLHAELGSILADLGDAAAAIESYDRAIALDPNLLDAHIDRAVVRHQQIDPTGGYRDLKGLAETRPDMPRILLNLGIMARKLGKLDESSDAVERLLALAPNDPKGLRLRAQLALDRGLPAVKLFRAARSVNANDSATMIGEAAALLSEGETEDAVSLLETGVAENPSWGEGHQLLAQIRWQSGNSDEFTDSYRAALAKEPQNTALWSDYIIATARATGHENALPLYEEARRAAGEQAAFDNLEANSLCELGELEQAGRLYEKLRDMEEPDYRLPLIRYCLKTGDFEKAQNYGLDLVEQGHGPDAWPYVSIAWRLMEDPRWLWLEGDRDLAQAHDLERTLALSYQPLQNTCVRFTNGASTRSNSHFAAEPKPTSSCSPAKTPRSGRSSAISGRQ